VWGPIMQQAEQDISNAYKLAELTTNFLVSSLVAFKIYRYFTRNEKMKFFFPSLDIFRRQAELIKKLNILLAKMVESKELVKIEQVNNNIQLLIEAIDKFIDCQNKENTTLLESIMMQLLNTQDKSMELLLSLTKINFPDVKEIALDFYSALHKQAQLLAEFKKEYHSKNLYKYFIDIESKADIWLKRNEQFILSSDTEKYKIYDISHGSLGSIAGNGLCYGFCLGAIQALMSAPDDKNLPFIKNMENRTNLAEIVRLQRLQPAYADKKSSQTHYFSIYANTIDYDIKHAAKVTAKNVYNICKVLDKKDNYAFGLTSGKNESSYHIIGILHKNGIFYVIDANSGIYKIEDISKLQNFITQYLWKDLDKLFDSTILQPLYNLYKTRSDHDTKVNLSYSITSIPTLEETILPIPHSLKSFIISTNKDDIESTAFLDQVLTASMDNINIENTGFSIQIIKPMDRLDENLKSENGNDSKKLRLSKL